jgi:epsilon-lactone hydrolase
MAAAVYDMAEIATSAWWTSTPAERPDDWRGRLAVAYVRAVIGFLHLFPRQDLRAPGYDWNKFRRFMRSVERVAARLPRETIREPALHFPVSAEWFGDPAQMANGGRTLLYVHGGSYVLERTPLHDVLAAELARTAQARVLAVDYALAPEHPFPAGIDDVVACYRRLMAMGHDPQQIAFVGDSAGAGLALAALIKLRDDGDPLPAAYVALSPWADLSFSGASIIYNAKVDPFMSDIEFVTICAELYRQGAAATHPLVSPALANLSGMPPTLIHVGSTDLLLDDARHIVDGIKAAGGKARLDIWRNMPHVWQRLAAYVPAASASLTAIGQFLRVTIPDRQPVRWDSAA